MKFNALLQFGAASLVLLLLALPLAAWMNSDPVAGQKIGASMANGIHGDFVHETAAAPMTDLSPDVLAATYVGASSCTATGHKFDIQIQVLDRDKSMFRIMNLLDEAEPIKAKLQEGQLNLGKQKMGSFTVTGSIVYQENPARIETKIRYEDGMGYCEEVGTFMKR